MTSSRSRVTVAPPSSPSKCALCQPQRESRTASAWHGQSLSAIDEQGNSVAEGPFKIDIRNFNFGIDALAVGKYGAPAHAAHGRNGLACSQVLLGHSWALIRHEGSSRLSNALFPPSALIHTKGRAGSPRSWSPPPRATTRATNGADFAVGRHASPPEPSRAK